MPPRHQPTSCTGRPPASSRRRAHGLRDHVLDPVLEPERAVAEPHPAVVDEVGLAPAPEQVLGQRAAAAQVEAQRRGGERRHQQHRQRGGPAPAAPQRQVAVHAPQRPLVDQRRRHPARVGEAAAHGRVEEVDGGADRVSWARQAGHREPMMTPGTRAAARPGARSPRAGAVPTPSSRRVGPHAGSMRAVAPTASDQRVEPTGATSASRRERSDRSRDRPARSASRAATCGRVAPAVEQHDARPVPPAPAPASGNRPRWWSAR